MIIIIHQKRYIFEDTYCNQEAKFLIMYQDS